MELICPSCEARYQIPEGAIGEKGRQVSCMNCGHGWHAYPPLVLGQPTPGAREPRGITPSPAALRGMSGAEVSTATPTEMDGRDDRLRPSASRSEQLAEIRQMLAEVQSDDGRPNSAGNGEGRAEPVFEKSEPVPEPPPISETDPTLEVVEDEPEEEFKDPLRERIARRAREEAGAKEPNVNKLRRRHERRERRLRTTKNARSGAFFTGLLLIVIVGAVMTALYLLKPEIVARVPGSDPALTEYVETIDSLRLSLAETFGAARDWVVERAERFL